MVYFWSLVKFDLCFYVGKYFKGRMLILVRWIRFRRRGGGLYIIVFFIGFYLEEIFGDVLVEGVENGG